ncbi:MAG: hypothetical protein DMG38_01915 [Acidobacteria bacterium]|nr:MAG: hypothetical protein DMG38_01915 [Acidobacteriota bacterium]
MPEPQPAKNLRVLCYEHHVQMKMPGVFTRMEDLATLTSAYSCPEAHCVVRYTPSNGYFACAKQVQAELDLMPRILCPRDVRPMYLAETNPVKSDFRLWRCPQCDSTRTNEEDRVNNVL